MLTLICSWFPWLLAFCAALQLVACSAGDTPQAAYAAYNRGIVDGISYEQEASWYSARNREVVEARIDALMERTNRSRDEVLAYYLSFTREYARCVDIELIQANVEGAQAELLYRQTNHCDSSEAMPQRKVQMIDENGWKIDQMELLPQLSG